MRMDFEIGTRTDIFGGMYLKCVRHKKTAIRELI